MSVGLNMFQSLGAIIAVYYVGVFLCEKIAVLRQYCIPAPVVGGLLFAIVNCVLYTQGIWTFKVDLTMQQLCMMLFFTSVGYTASVSLIRRGGIAVLKMAAITVFLIILQNLISLSLTHIFHLGPLMGLATGSIPMIGGHATAAAFGPVLENMGLANGTTIAVAAATFGLVSGGIIGGPVGETLVKKFHLHSREPNERLDPEYLQPEREMLEAIVNHREDAQHALEHECRCGQSINNHRFMHGMAHLGLAMGLGTLISKGFVALGLIFPAYIGSMLMAAIIRNIADFTHVYKVYQRESEVLGNIGLTIFLTCVLMGLQLWQLYALALPMMAILAIQTLCIAGFAYFLVYRIMGKNYEAAVMASGVCGFGLGATPNAIANMTAITELFGPAPAAFFVIPLIGSLIIDPVNASVLMFFLNLFR